MENDSLTDRITWEERALSTKKDLKSLAEMVNVKEFYRWRQNLF